MPTQLEKQEYQRRWHAAHRADPEWLARHRQHSRERARNHYHVHKAEPKTPERIERERETKRRWHLKRKDTPEYRARMRQIMRKYRERHKDNPEFLARQAVYARKTKEKPRPELTPEKRAHRRERQRAYRAAMTPEQRALAHAAKREWMRVERVDHPERVRTRTKQLHERNPAVKLARNLRTRLWHAVRGKTAKSASVVELVGCNFEELKAHLESLFQPGMSWGNYNFRGWHVDHIKPCAKFDLTDPAQQRACFHYTNLQPLWAHDNQVKHAR